MTEGHTVAGGNRELSQVYGLQLRVPEGGWGGGGGLTPGQRIVSNRQVCLKNHLVRQVLNNIVITCCRPH